MTHIEDHHRINILFENDPENTIHTMDVFGHRIQPLQGYSLEDVIIYLVALGLGASHRGNYFYHHTIVEITSLGLNAPFALIKPGAIVYSSDDVVTGGMVVTAGPDCISLGDGRSIPARSYRMSDFFDSRLERQRDARMERIIDYINEPTPRVQVMMSLVAESLPAAFNGDTLDRLSAIYARIIRLVELDFASGATGSASANEAMKSFWRDLTSYWILEPNHIHQPETYVPNSDLSKAIAANAPEHLRAMAREVLASAKDVDAKDLEFASVAKRGESLGDSSHQSLQMFSAIRKLDQRIEETAPLEMLKPGARKRQEKLRTN
jgi:hypothetical protein